MRTVGGGAPTCAGVAVCCGVMGGSTMRGCAHVALVRIVSSSASPRGDMRSNPQSVLFEVEVRTHLCVRFRSPC
jgi:hypothetical protein